MKLFVTGSSGFLGKKVSSILSKEHEVEGSHVNQNGAIRRKFDLEDIDGMKEMLTSSKPDVVVHTASWANVKKCEEEQERAGRINGEASSEIARWCDENGAMMIYISSDYIFSGNNSPYSEEDEAHPLNHYGKTKLQGEDILGVNENFVVLRIPILYGYNDKGDKHTFVSIVINLLEKGESIPADNHRIKYPVLIDDVADFILQTVESGGNGIYHLSTDEPMTRYEWALKIAAIFEYPSEKIQRDDEPEKDSFPPKPINVRLQNNRHNFEFKSVENGLEIMKGQLAP